VSESLPRIYAITAPLEAEDSQVPILQQTACRQWLAGFERLFDSGIDLIQLRAKELKPGHLESLARRCQRLAAEHGVRILLNGPPEIVSRLELAGVHLTSRALLSLRNRPLPEEYLVAASCHSPRELAHAERIGADFVCLSPVKPVAAYKITDNLGLKTFGQWARNCRIPVFGLGGLGPEDLTEIRRAGGHGVAGISAFWSRSRTIAKRFPG
jgi:thiamine-phosphate diphosphorylase